MGELALVEEDILVKFRSNIREEHMVGSEIIAIEETPHPK